MKGTKVTKGTQGTQGTAGGNARAPRRYGLDFFGEGLVDAVGNVNELAIELACYRDPGKFPTGRAREFHFRRAFEIVWPQFQWNEWVELLVWAWCNYRLVSVIGHTRASKTFGMAHIALLDYLAAPQWTATSFTTTKFDALKQRLWGDMLKAVDATPFKDYILSEFLVQTSSNELKLSIRGRERLGDSKHVIQGFATDSADRSAGKLRGQHADRRRIVVDEAQDVARAIYMAFLNAMSAPDFRGVLLSNPVDRNTEFGEWCRPRGGWGTVSDTDLHWETEKRDGVCLHFDGLQSPNVRAGRTVFPFLLTQDYVDGIRPDTVEWWMMVRGFFPPDGLVPRVWPSQAVEAARAVVEFDFEPEWCASLDPAFDDDQCVLVLAQLGRLRGGKWHMAARKSLVIVVESGGALPKDYQIAREVMRVCREHGVKPGNFIMDTTGNGRGVYAILQVEWDAGVQSLNYWGEATERPLRSEDALGAHRQVRYFVSELWFRASFLARDGQLSGLDALDGKAREDLEARRYSVRQYGVEKVMIVESKAELRARLGRSPDHGDTFCQLGELMVRRGLMGGAGGGGALRRQWERARERGRGVNAIFGMEWGGGRKPEGLKAEG